MIDFNNDGYFCDLPCQSVSGQYIMKLSKESFLVGEMVEYSYIMANWSQISSTQTQNGFGASVVPRNLILHTLVMSAVYLNVYTLAVT